MRQTCKKYLHSCYWSCSSTYAAKYTDDDADDAADGDDTSNADDTAH